MNTTELPSGPVERIVSQQHDIAAPLREAEAQIAIALARLSKLGPGGLSRYGWAGSWAEYQKIAQLLCKTRALAELIEHRQRRIPRSIRSRKPPTPPSAGHSARGTTSAR